MSSKGSIQELFHAALEREDPVERARFLDEACGEDTALRERLERLLRAQAEVGAFMAPPTRSVGPVLTEKPGDKIGRYKLLQQIGEGGCGVVYMAEQEEPVRRRVALKVIKLGMDTKQVIARFEAERQALAMMDHPNIARVLDAGATDSGRPFFVMELVRGTKITEFCDEKKFSTKERLDLFLKVCSAIQHAHQKGVIHRDVKPSNILVTMVDGVAVPKVIDFGIAKATNNQPLTDKTLFTAFEQFIGTPAYMSPEQAELSGVDIDTRTDIYSLGVVLYELLTGGPPFDQKELLAAGLDAMRRTIREEEPPRPSNRLSTMAAEELTTTAQRRHVEPPKLIHQVRGDLDWIAMKCLEKDRGRRYETANALAADIRRHLDNEPVVARPPSRWYEFQKTVRRHKFGFAATAAVMVALGIGLGFSTWTLLKEKQARERAVAAEREESRLRQEAQSSATRAEAEAERAAANATEADEQRKRTIALAEENRRNLYAARVKLTAQAIDEGDVPRARDLLDGLRPQKGEEDLRSFDWYYLYQLASNEKLALTRVGGRVRSVAYSPDGRLLAAGSDDAIVRLWDAETHELRAELKGHTGVVAAVSFSPDGKMLASAGADGTMRIWDVIKAQAISLCQQETNGLAALAFSPDGSLIAVSEGGAPVGNGNPFTRYAQCSGQGRILLWNTKTHQLERILNTGSHDALSVVFAPDGRHLVAGGIHSTLTRFDVATGERMLIQTNLPGPVFASVFLSDQELAAASWNPYEDSGQIIIFDSATLERRRQMLFAGKVTCLALAPDGKTLAAAGADRVLRLREVATGQEIGTFHGHKWEIWSVAFSPDGKNVATGGFDDVIRIWDTTSDPARQGIPSRYAFSVAYSPDGRLLACSGRMVQIYDAATGALLRTLEGYSGGDVRVAFSPDGSILAATDGSEGIHFWDVRTWEDWSPGEEDMAPQMQASGWREDTKFAFSPDSTTLVRAGKDRVIRFWEARTGKLTATIKQSANSVDYTPDGLRLISGDGHGLVLWNLESQRAEAREVGAGSLLRVSKDGRWLAYAAERLVNICELPSLLPVRTLHAHRDPIWGLSFSHDGKILATASWDGSVKLWQVTTGQELFTIPSHAGVVWSVEFSPDDRALTFGSGGGSMGRTGKLTILRCATLDRVSQETQELQAEKEQKAASALAASGESHARAGRWQEATTELTALLELRPAENYTHHQLTALLIQKGDFNEYRRHCGQIIKEFASTTDPITAERMAKDCLIHPDSAAELEAVNRMVDVAIGADESNHDMPWFQFVKGLAEYRQGHFAGAKEWMRKALGQEEFKELKAQTYLALAMTEHQLHHPDAARSAIRNAVAIIEKDLPRLESGDIGGYWVDWVFVHALQREACQLIDGEVAPNASNN